VTINVTSFVNSYVQNNPQASANVKAGASAATALFSAMDSNNLDASTLLAAAPGAANALSGIDKGAIPSVGNNVSTQQAAKKNQNVGIEKSTGDGFTKGAPRSLLDEPDAPIGVPLAKIDDDIPILLENEVKALMVQIGYMATEWDYQKTNYDTHQYGRYQVHPKTLRNYGYMFSGNLDFTGKDGIYYSTEFLFDSNVQDRIMERFIKDQYRALIKAGGIRKYDTKEIVAGMIAVAYQFQDANPSVSSLTGLMSGIDMTSIISGSGDLSTVLSSTLASGQTQIGKSTSVLSTNSTLSSTSGSFANQVNASDVPATLQKLTPTLFNAAASGDPAAAKAAVESSGIKDQYAKLGSSTVQTIDPSKDKLAGLPNEVKSQLNPGVTGSTDQAKLVAAKVDVAKLQAGASDFASSLPASKAKSWREKGTEKDSQGVAGSFYYNGGKHAIRILAADVTTDDTGP
jgi:hypothetical protein